MGIFVFTNAKTISNAYERMYMVSTRQEVDKLVATLKDEYIVEVSMKQLPNGKSKGTKKKILRGG